MDGCSNFAVFLTRCTRYLRSQTYAALAGRAWTIRDNLWTNLLLSGNAYAKQATSFITLAWDGAILEIPMTVLSLLREITPALVSFVSVLREAQLNLRTFAEVNCKQFPLVQAGLVVWDVLIFHVRTYVGAQF